MTKKMNIADLKKGPKQGLLNKTPNDDKPERHRIVKKEKPKKLGRTPLAENEKLSKKITVNLQAGEYDKLVEKSKENFNVPLPQLVRALLKKHGVI